MTEQSPTPALSPLRIEIDSILTKYECYVTGTACTRPENLTLQDATDQLEAIVERERLKAVQEAFDRHGPWTSRNTEVMDSMFPASE